MGSGISRVNSVTPSGNRAVHFGKVEVRTYKPDRWETMPLLNTHETARIEAKIKAMPNQPVQPPRPAMVQVSRPKSHKKYIFWGATAILTGIVCGAAGPFGLIVPAVAILLYFVHKSAQPKKIHPEILAEKITAIRDLTKLAEKYERSGLLNKAKVYKQMALTIQDQVQKNI